MTRRRIEPWDFPSCADEGRRAFAPEIIDGEYVVVNERRLPRPVGYASCLIITFAAMVVLLPLRLGATDHAGGAVRAHIAKRHAGSVADGRNRRRGGVAGEVFR
jgi:hypothetical protein